MPARDRRRRRIRAPRLVAASLALGALLLGACGLVAPEVTVEWTNGVRADSGVHPLTWDAGLTECAQEWADGLASARGGIRHDSDLFACAPPGSSTVGENVSSAPTLDGAYQAILDSPSHLELLLDPVWTTFGVGIAESAGNFYVVWRFAG